MKPKPKVNFIEAKTVEYANSISLEDYTFVRFSETRQCYIFKIRQRKR